MLGSSTRQIAEKEAQILYSQSDISVTAQTELPFQSTLRLLHILLFCFLFSRDTRIYSQFTARTTTTTMAGYGNRTAPDYAAEDLQDQHTNTRLGLIDSNTAYHEPHEKHGSGITGGAGFGTYLIFLPICVPRKKKQLYLYIPSKSQTTNDAHHQ